MNQGSRIGNTEEYYLKRNMGKTNSSVVKCCELDNKYEIVNNFFTCRQSRINP